jgi:transaldolase
MANQKAEQIFQSGVSLWLDSLSREMLDSGWLADKLDSWGLRGQTSNPTIFEQSISQGTAYDAAVKDAANRGLDKVATCWELMIEDVQRACDFFKPMYDQTAGGDGYVSLELDPTKAEDTEASLKQAHELWKRVDRPNLMLKVPATQGGLPVIEETIASGYNVNVTLLFSEEMYRQVMDRFLCGLERRDAQGLPLDKIASVASFFVSRVDGEVDKRLEAIGSESATNLMGKIAVANARVAYAAFQEVIADSDRFAKLKAKGANVQRPLWASTSTKNPSYLDTLYVDELIGPDCVNTVPENTLAAALEHGKSAVTLTKDNEALAREQLAQLKTLGIDLHEITNVLLLEQGVSKFAQSYESLLDTLESALKDAQSAGAAS